MTSILTRNAIAKLRYILAGGHTGLQDQLVEALRDKMLLDCDEDAEVEVLLKSVVRYLQDSVDSGSPEWAYTRHVIHTIDEVLK